MDKEKKRQSIYINMSLRMQAGFLIPICCDFYRAACAFLWKLCSLSFHAGCFVWTQFPIWDHRSGDQAFSLATAMLWNNISLKSSSFNHFPLGKKIEILKKKKPWSKVC